MNSDPLLVNLVLTNGTRYERVRVHGIGGLMKVHDGWRRLQHRLANTSEVLRVYTKWTAIDSEFIDVSPSDVAECTLV